MLCKDVDGEGRGVATGSVPVHPPGQKYNVVETSEVVVTGYVVRLSVVVYVRVVRYRDMDVEVLCCVLGVGVGGKKTEVYVELLLCVLNVWDRGGGKETGLLVLVLDGLP